MKISATHTRAVMGHDITISIEAGDSEAIAWVQVQLDSFVLATDVLDPAETNFERSFAQVGDAGPMMDHELLVDVVSRKRERFRSSAKWVDPV